MSVPVHSAGMQSMFWGARDFSTKRTKTQVQHHLLAGPGFGIMAPLPLHRLFNAALHDCIGSFCWHAEHIM